MKKRQQLLLMLIGVILALAACSNESAAEPNAIQSNEIQSNTIQSNANTQREESGKKAPEDAPAKPALDKEKPASEENKSGNEASQEAENAWPEQMDGYPSAEEISAALEDEKGTVYWLAPDPAVPDVCQTLNAEAVNVQALWDAIHDRVFENANLTVKEMPDGFPYPHYQFHWNDRSWELEIGEFSIGLRCDATLDGDARDSILKVLTERTGMGVSFETREADHYAFTCNGLTLDEGGYSLSAEEWIPETIVWLDNDRISICYPILIQGDGETIGTESFVDMDSARAIYEAYWVSSGISSVSVITDVELVYYFADGQLLPAWRLIGQQYMSPNGHDILALIDAVSGELLRDS